MNFGYGLKPEATGVPSQVQIQESSLCQIQRLNPIFGDELYCQT